MLSKSMEFGDKKVPDIMIESAIVLQKQIYKAIDLKIPLSRAYAIKYFKDTYKENKDDPYHHTFRAVAALHLASKVCEDAKNLAKFVFALQECKRSERCAAALSVLGHINNIGDDFIPFVTKNLKLHELDLIQDLHFNFHVTLPYDYVH